MGRPDLGLYILYYNDTPAAITYEHAVAANQTVELSCGVLGTTEGHGTYYIHQSRVLDRHAIGRGGTSFFSDSCLTWGVLQYTYLT